MLLKEQNGVSIWRNEKPFFKQASSTEGVERTITTGVISSSSICPNGVLAGSIVAVDGVRRLRSVGERTQIGSMPLEG